MSFQQVVGLPSTYEGADITEQNKAESEKTSTVQLFSHF